MNRNLHDFNRDGSVDLNLTQEEALTVKVALSSMLEVYREQLGAAAVDNAPGNSHIGQMKAMIERVSHVRMGRKLWNRGRD